MVQIVAPFSIDASYFRAVSLGGTMGERLFEVAPVGYAAGMPDLQPVGEASYGGYRMVSMAFEPDEADPGAADISIMVCQGDQYEISSASTMSEMRFEQFQAFLDQFDLEETSQGIALHPRSGSDVTVKTRSLSSLIPDVCGLVSYFEASGAGLPASDGRRVDGGQLWRVQDRGSLIVGNDAVITEVTPFTSVAELSAQESGTENTEMLPAVMTLAEQLNVELIAVS